MSNQPISSKKALSKRMSNVLLLVAPRVVVHAKVTNSVASDIVPGFLFSSVINGESLKSWIQNSILNESVPLIFGTAVIGVGTSPKLPALCASVHPFQSTS
ncbi:MAG: hypothetical protein J6V44_12040 [Methanobrevibacter sp.]|nr:hypothetical protein [Methanobrevibacter sp.]